MTFLFLGNHIDSEGGLARSGFTYHGHMKGLIGKRFRNAFQLHIADNLRTTYRKIWVLYVVHFCISKYTLEI